MYVAVLFVVTVVKVNICIYEGALLSVETWVKVTICIYEGALLFVETWVKVIISIKNMSESRDFTSFARTTLYRNTPSTSST